MKKTDKALYRFNPYRRYNNGNTDSLQNDEY